VTQAPPVAGEADDEWPIEVYHYRRGREHPRIIRDFGGFKPRWPITPLMTAVALGSLWLLHASMRLWAAPLPGPVAVVLLFAVPVALAAAVQYLRMEGRAPLHMLAGLATLAAAPRRGRRHGQPVRPARRRRVGGPVWTGALPSRPARPEQRQPR
jgi:hypothetical protein